MGKPTHPAVLVRLHPDVKALLQAEADAQTRTLTNLVKKIILDHCEQTKGAKRMNGHAPAKSAPRVTA